MFKLFNAIWRSSCGKFVCIVLSSWVLIAIISIFWTPYSLLETNGFSVWKKPSFAHWLGTDGAGADILSWLMAGSGTELLIVICTICVSTIVGFSLLLLMIAKSHLIQGVSLIIVDALISIPTVLIALMLAVPLGTTVIVIILACGIGYGFNLARIVLPSAQLVLQSDYVSFAISKGSSRNRVILRHVLPNIMPVSLVQISLSAGTVILAESGLTYLGVGVPSGVASWGRVLATSLTLIHVNPLAVLWPGLIVTLVVVALNLLGDSLREALTPESQKSLHKHSDELSLKDHE